MQTKCASSTSSPRALRGLILCWLFAVAVELARAAGPQAAPPADGADAPLKEIEIAPGAFVRGAPVPPWADLMSLPPAGPGAAAKPVVTRMADTHFRVTGPTAYVVNRAEQANETSALGYIGQPQLAFNPQYQRLLLHKVLVVRGGQIIDHTANVPVRFLQREADLEKGVYSGVITASLLLPDVRVGDVLHLIYTVEGSNPIFGERFADTASWEGVYPTELRRVTLSGPSGRVVNWRFVGGSGGDVPEPRITERDGMRRLRFEQRNLRAVELEQLIPSSVPPFRFLQFSEFSNWQDVAQWAGGLFPRQVALPEALTREVERLRTVVSDDDRVMQALQWVQSQIRYYSIALGDSSHRPAPPAEVLQRRYGDCKDKSQLLVQMLRALGFNADPVLATLSAPRIPGLLLPSPLAFDHVAVRVQVGDRVRFIDPARVGQGGSLAYLGQHLEGALVLPVSPLADALLAVQSPNRDEIFSSELSERFTLSTFDGTATLDTEQRLVGLQAEGLRLALPGMDAAQREKWALLGYERRYPGISLDGAAEFIDEPQRNRITVRARYRVPELARDAGPVWIARFTPTNFHGSFPIPEQIASRRFPVAIAAWPLKLNYRLEMQLPSSVAVISDPSTEKIDTPYMHLDVSRSFRGNVARINVNLQALAESVPAGDLPRMVGDLRKLDQMIGGSVVVDKSQLKSQGILGIGRTTIQDRMREQIGKVVERTGKVIAAGQLTGEDLAAALCARAEAYADLGEGARGLQDAEQAVRVAPQHGRSLECRGNLHWASGEFAKAQDDYSKALTLTENPADLLYRRGRARFFLNRYDVAADDFAKAASTQSDESARQYYKLWQAFALLRQGRALPEALKAEAAQSARGEWPRPVLALLAGLMTTEQLIAHIDATKRGDERELALAEAWFYIGESQLALGRRPEARRSFENVRAKGVTMFIEHVAAGFELGRLAP